MKKSGPEKRSNLLWDFFSSVKLTLSLLIILAIIALIFGVGRLPEVGSSIGKSINEFKQAIKPEDPENDSKMS